MSGRFVAKDRARKANEVGAGNDELIVKQTNIQCNINCGELKEAVSVAMTRPGRGNALTHSAEPRNQAFVYAAQLLTYLIDR